MPSYIMLLNDGETWTNVENCAIIRLPDDLDEIEAIEDFLDDDAGVSAESTVVFFDTDQEGLHAKRPDGGKINLA